MKHELVHLRREWSHLVDRPTTSTRVIALSHDLPAERADDRKAAASPSRARDQRRHPETSSPGDAALRAIVKLLARQAAEEGVSSQE